ncbi:MAG: hypothetical protein PVH87_28050 [Desulfobacteraceae bacterium]|jgi:hypothetical protein
MVTETEAIQIATDFIIKETGQAHKLYGAKLIDFDKRKDSNEGDKQDVKSKSHWAVSFETKIEDDIILDGPTIVLVDTITKEVFFFPNLM